jgi:uroporphyrinogen-III synthase
MTGGAGRDTGGMVDEPLRGLTIGVTADRRAAQQATLLEKRGATVRHGPAVQVFSDQEDQVLKAATAEVIARPPDFVLASTGFGMRAWATAAETWGLREDLLGALVSARVANRGAKAASANEAAGVAEWYRAPHERLDELIARVLDEPLAGRRVVLQLRGVPERDGVAALRAAGAEVIEIDAYRLGRPADPGPAHDLIRSACADQLAAVTFVTAPAVHNLFALAADIGLAAELRRALNASTVAACVGPVCAEGAIDEGIREPVVPERARLVPMVQALTERLAAKQ